MTLLTYVAKYGDYLVGIADRHGTTWQEIWNHPLNADGIKRTAGANTVIKRNALNAIRAILAKREVRLLLLHTCTLGANRDFVQLLSNRLQVRIRAHKVHVTYIGSTPIAASYEDDPPLPQGDHEWPMSQLAFEVAPGAVPSK